MDIARPQEKTRWPRWARIAGIAVGASVAVSASLAYAKRAAPIVDRSSLWVGTVTRGPMLREVKGPGSLVPERVRYVTAETSGRVDRIHARAGAVVESGSILMELGNPDVVLQALEADREVADAESCLVERRARLEAQELTEREMVATIRGQSFDAQRRARAMQLGAGQVFTQLDAYQAQTRAEELVIREGLAEARTAVATRTLKEELSALRVKVSKQRKVSEFRQKQVEALRVRAGGAGVVQDSPLEIGQWVTPGTVLAKVVRPDELKAVLRIAEALAKDIVAGQRARIDTHNGIIPGRVARVATAARSGTVDVEVTLEGPLPKGARPDLTVDGVIEIERLAEVLAMPRPVGGVQQPNVTLFRLDEAGEAAVRIPATLGHESASAIEVKQGLAEGDRVILSDMVRWDAVDRVRIR